MNPPPPPSLVAAVAAVLLTPLICAFLGRKRFGGVLLGVLIGLLPVLGILIVLLLPKKKTPEDALAAREFKASDFAQLLKPQFVTGEVVHVVSRDESYTTGGGGGGSISTSSDGYVSGYIAPTWVRTDIVKKDEVWLRLGSGKEVSYNFPREKFQCRAGHRLTLAYLDGFLVAVRNHTTERDEYFITMAEWKRSHFERLCPRFWTRGMVLLGIFFWPIGIILLISHAGDDSRNMKKAQKLWEPLSRVLELRYQTIETGLKSVK